MSKWIKCSERMSELNQDVLAWHRHGFCMMGFYRQTKNPNTYQIEWLIINGSGVIDATHWQPLPEPPDGIIA